MPERICGYEVHPAASLFPLMAESELDELARDIATRGQDQPILLYEGKVLDGRNRLLACQKAGVQPRIAEWVPREPGASAISFVLSANVRRRHLTESQRAIVAAEMLPLFEAEARARRLAGLKKGRERPVSAPVREREREKAADRAAAAAAVSTRYVEAAKAVAQRSPELAQRVRAGEITLKRAEKEIRKAEQVRALKSYVPPTGRYNVIVADPPWPYEDTLDGSDAARGGLPYPPMTIAQICALQLPADEDCVLWLWVTNAHLVDGSAQQVLRAWGFSPKTILTWDKQRMGAGRWLRGVTEHCILATRGRPLITLTNQTTLISEPRREHSRKPESFYRLVESLCPSPHRIELFARAPREGWVTDGIERDLYRPATSAQPAAEFEVRWQQEEEARALREAVAADALAAIVEKVERSKETPASFLRTALIELGAHPRVLRRRGWNEEREQQAAARKFNEAQLRGLLIETILAGNAYDIWHDYKQSFREACDAWGIDLQALEQARKQKAKDAPAKKAKKGRAA